MMRVIRALLLAAASLPAQDSDLVLQGIQHFHRGEYAAARAILEKAPQDERARTFLAISRAATGSCDRAAKELASEFERNSDSELRRLAGLALVQCQLIQNRFEDATTTLARLKTAYPGDADVLYQSARLHMKAWNDAVFQMFQKTPSSFRVNQLSAEIFEIQGKYAEAIAEYRKAIEKNPAAINLHFRLGRAILMQSHAPEDLALARQEFEQELKLNPNDAVAQYQIGQILLAEQKPSEAVVRFERAVAQAPEFPEALLALGKACLEAQRFEEAMRLLEKVVRMQPNNEAAHYSLMMAYRNAGRAADAARERMELEKLQRPPEGEFTEFLKRLGEKTPKP